MGLINPVGWIDTSIVDPTDTTWYETLYVNLKYESEGTSILTRRCTAGEIVF